MITFWPQLFTFCVFILAWLFWMDYKKHIRWVMVLTGWYWGNRAPNQVKKCVFLNFLFRRNCGYLLKLPMKKYVFVLIFIWFSLSFSAQEITMINFLFTYPCFYLCIIVIFTVSIEKSMASDFAPDSTLFLPHWCYFYRLHNICVITVYRCNVFSVFFFYF